MIGSDLPILVHWERVQPKDFQRWRVVKPKFEGSLLSVTFWVVLGVLGFGESLSFEFLRCSLLPVYVGCTSSFWRFFIHALFVYKKKTWYYVYFLIPFTSLKCRENISGDGWITNNKPTLHLLVKNSWFSGPPVVGIDALLSWVICICLFVFVAGEWWRGRGWGIAGSRVGGLIKSHEHVTFLPQVIDLPCPKLTLEFF